MMFVQPSFTARVFSWGLALLIGLCMSRSAAAAVSIDNSVTTTTDPALTYDSTFQYWNNVGDLAANTTEGGGVYLTNGWVLAPAHIGTPGGFYFNGTFYPRDDSTPPVTIYNDPGTNSSPADLVLYKVQTQSLPALATLPITAATPAVGTSVLMMGFGYARQTPLTYWDASGNQSKCV
jgi:hypothetical protein